MRATVDVFYAFLRLGLSAFGGPVAHLGYFRDEFVRRRRWLNEADYAEIVALCQFLPGPASSQVGMALGLRRAGLPGLVAAWFAFTIPSALLLFAFALGQQRYADALGGGWLAGVKAAAAAVVAHAVIGMARTLLHGWTHALIALAGALLALAFGGVPGQLAAIATGGLAGWIALRDPGTPAAGAIDDRHVPLRRAAVALGSFALLLLGLPLASWLTTSPHIDIADRFYRVGALVFGGGHVVLPMLDAEFVDRGWVARDNFLAGYGAAQAVPGPLFSFAAYLGAVMQPGGGAIATLALFAIFLPSALLICGVLPFWARLRALPGARRVLAGVNAAVVGLLAAALWDPVLPAGITGIATGMIALAAFALLIDNRVPAWALVLAAAAAGAALA